MSEGEWTKTLLNNFFVLVVYLTDKMKHREILLILLTVLRYGMTQQPELEAKQNYKWDPLDGKGVYFEQHKDTYFYKNTWTILTTVKFRNHIELVTYMNENYDKLVGICRDLEEKNEGVPCFALAEEIRIHLKVIKREN